MPEWRCPTVQVLVDYFRNARDKHWEARGEYLRGYILYHYVKEGEQAVSAYRKAEGLATSIADNRLLAHIYNGMAYLYHSQHMLHEADSLYKMLEKLAMQTCDTVLLVESWERQSIYLIGQGKAHYREAEQMLLRNDTITGRKGLTLAQCSNALTLSQLYSYMDNGEQTLRFARKALGLQPKDTSLLSTAFLFTGEGFYRLGTYDSAAYYFQKVADSGRSVVRSAAYMRLSNIAEKQGDARKALEYEKLRDRYEKRYRQEAQTTEIQLAEHAYRSSQKQQAIWYIVYGCMAAIVFLLLVIGCLIGWHRWKEKKAHRQLKNAMLRQMDEHCDSDNADREVSSLPEKDFRLDALQEYIEGTEIYRKMQRILDYHKHYSDYQEHVIPKEQQELVDAIEQFTGGFVTRLKQQFVELNEEEIYFCCIHLFDFNPTEISIIMEKDRSGIYKKRKALLTRKFKCDDKIELKSLLKNI